MDASPALLPARPPEEQTRIPWGPIGASVYRRTYSFLKNGRLIREAQVSGAAAPPEDWETWPETVRRVAHGNISLVPADRIEPGEEDRLVELMLPFGLMPGGRHLAASGVPGRQFLMNCHAAGYDREDPAAHFTFLFDQLMQGGGVGSNYSNRYLHAMMPVLNSVDVVLVCDEAHPDYADMASLCHPKSQFEGRESEVLYWKVADSREGWVQTVDIVCNAAWVLPPLGKQIVFDLSDLRKKGSILVSSGGKAAGPAPLAQLLTDFVNTLNPCVGRQLNSLEVMGLDHSIAACVVAGGKRRSSRIAVKSWKDRDILDFIICKRTDGRHWTTNISVEIDDEYFAAMDDQNHILHSWAYLVHHETVLAMRTNGEPGFWNRSLSSKGEREPERMFCPNPCGEIGLYMWEACNLGHVNLEYFAQKARKLTHEAFRLMTRFLMRATFGDFPSARQKLVQDENRRIGVGFMGFHSWLLLHGIKYSEAFSNPFVRDQLACWYNVVHAEAESYAKVLGIPVPVKSTTLAPTGTGALLPGVPSSMQALFSGWGIRRVRMSDTDSELARKKAEGYPTYPDPDARNTQIVEFWYEDPLVSKLRAANLNPDDLIEGQDEIPFEHSLALQKLVQDWYADNSISFTINVPNDKRPSLEGMKRLFREYLPNLKGTTYFPDVSRRNPPFQRITKEEFYAYTGPKEIVTVEQECFNGSCPAK